MPGRRRVTRCAAVAVLLTLLAPMASSPATADRDRELEALRARIGQINEQMRKDVARRDTALDALRSAEGRIEAVRKNLAGIRAERAAGEERLRELAARQAEREAALAAGKGDLAGQVRAAFMNGRQEQLRMLFNQENPATAGRMTVYYRYLSEQRAERINVVAGQVAELRALAAEVAAQTRALADLEARRGDELAALQSAREERASLVNRINARLQESGAAVATMREEESRLVELIRELEELLRDFPVGSQEAFSRLRGELAWPVRGRLLADFGQPRVGREIKWNGVLVGAERGAPVRAIARGRVAFSDWLPGLGLLVVLEHSEGYISLYGHNDTLTREAGEWLDAGDVLATVGDSGGQPRPALYFEIRRGKTPQNPHPWFRRSVGAR